MKTEVKNAGAPHGRRFVRKWIGYIIAYIKTITKPLISITLVTIFIPGPDLL